MDYKDELIRIKEIAGKLLKAEAGQQKMVQTIDFLEELRDMEV